jgi:hypothetical protein
MIEERDISVAMRDCESASNIDPTLIRVQAVEVSVKFLNFFGSHRRPIGTPTDLNKLVSNQRVRSVWRGVNAGSRFRFHHRCNGKNSL